MIGHNQRLGGTEASPLLFTPRSKKVLAFDRYQRLSVMAVILSMTGVILAAPSAIRQQCWDFGSDEVQQIASGFEASTGRWEVISEDENQVLAQLAENRDSILNVALNEETSYKNIELTVRIKPIAGENEGGGGLIWRARDPLNFYAINYNPFVSRHKRTKPYFRLYKIENGKRTQLAHCDVDGEVLSEIVGEAPHKSEWHTLKVTMFGGRIFGYLDGKRLLQADDDTFVDVGRIGLITKSDARTYFDDLNVSTLRERERDE